MSAEGTEGAVVRGRRAAVGFILVSVWLDVLSLGVIIPAWAPLMQEQFTGGDRVAAARWLGISSTIWALAQFVGAPILGGLSDRFGRRPVLLISLFGLAFDYVMMAFAPTIGWLLVARVVSGLTAAGMAVASAYIADVTPPEQRAKTFGLMSSAFSFGFVIGPALGGFIGGLYGLRAPFIAAAALTLINALYGLLILPESLPPERRAQAFDWKKANPLGALRLLRSQTGLLGLSGVGFLFQIAQVVLPSCFVLYTTHRYGWSTQFLGVTFFITGVLGVLVQWTVVGPFVARFGERTAVLFGALCGAAGFAWYATAPSGWLYLAGAPVFALWGLLMPGLQGLMTRRMAPHQQGQLQGANQSLAGIAAILGPPLYGEVFAWSLRNEASLHMPGLAIYVASALMLGAFVLASAYARPQAATAAAE